MRRTRILSTVGPASESPEQLRALIDAGTDAFRLNFSHGTRESHKAICTRIRAAAADAGRPIGIVQDLSGPKIRIGSLDAPIDLAAGDTLTIAFGSFTGGGARVSCSFEPLFTSVPAGGRLLVDDGRIELEVTAASPDELKTTVTTGGRLESHKGISVPGLELRTSAVTEKDAADLAAGLAMGVDMVAVSFVQSADDIRRVRSLAASYGTPDIALIAKIEKPQALVRIDEILDEADAVMVARGDLGIEIPLEAVPAAEKMIVRGARSRGRPVIVATHVLDSMRSAPRPTRAEVTDAAHAVDEGADAIMLAGETAVGSYAALAVATLDRIAREAERHVVDDGTSVRPDARAWTRHGLALSQAAVALANGTGADAIVAVTEGGRTARMLSALRPRAQILAATPNAAIAARLSLVWGVTPFVRATTALDDLRGVVRTAAGLASGGTVVFVSMDESLDNRDSNYVRVEKL
jgi:pyruvate kinase